MVRFRYYYFNHYPAQNSFFTLPSLPMLTEIPEAESHAWLLWRLQGDGKSRKNELTDTGQWAANWIAGYSHFSADSSWQGHHPVWLWVCSCWLRNLCMLLASWDSLLLHPQSGGLSWVSLGRIPSLRPNLYKAWGKWRPTYLKSIYLRIINQVNKLLNEICSIVLAWKYRLTGFVYICKNKSEKYI